MQSISCLPRTHINIGFSPCNMFVLLIAQPPVYECAIGHNGLHGLAMLQRRSLPVGQFWTATSPCMLYYFLLPSRTCRSRRFLSHLQRHCSTNRANIHLFTCLQGPGQGIGSGLCHPLVLSAPTCDLCRCVVSYFDLASTRSTVEALGGKLATSLMLI